MSDSALFFKTTTNGDTPVSSTDPLPVTAAFGAGVVGGGTEAAALRVTIANNSTGVVSVDDNGAALTVDGSVGVTSVTYPTPAAGADIAPTVFQDFGAVAKDTVKASAGNVFSVLVTSVSASLRYFQLHNKASDPAGTEVPIVSIPLPAGTATQPTIIQLGPDFFAPSLRLGTGIGWAISTTLATFTDAATANEHTVVVMYK